MSFRLNYRTIQVCDFKKNSVKSSRGADRFLLSTGILTQAVQFYNNKGTTLKNNLRKTRHNRYEKDLFLFWTLNIFPDMQFF